MTKRERRKCNRKRIQKRVAKKRKQGGYKPPKPPKKSREFEDPYCEDPLAGKLTKGITTRHPYYTSRITDLSPAATYIHARGGTK